MKSESIDIKYLKIPTSVFPLQKKMMKGKSSSESKGWKEDSMIVKHGVSITL